MARPTRKDSLLPTNPQCIHSGPLGLGCIALEQVDPRCGFGLCPFFKREDEQKEIERKCKKRLRALNLDYKTWEETIRSYYVESERYKKYQKRKEEEKI